MLFIVSYMKNEIIKAIKIANEILSNKIDTNIGCGLISELSTQNNSPDELQIFELLAHEQYEHEHIGITAENKKPQIIEECKILVKNST